MTQPPPDPQVPGRQEVIRPAERGEPTPATPETESPLVARTAQLNTINEVSTKSPPGLLMYIVGGAGMLLALALGGLGALIPLFTPGWLIALPLFAVSGWILSGVVTVNPNMALVLTRFGRYVGTERRNGRFWINPLSQRDLISLKVQNFNSQTLKVNDARGNPIEIAAVVVWRVRDTARASFNVENYQAFVAIQSETALRHIAAQYPYDGDDGEDSLRSSPEVVAEALVQELQERLQLAGIDVIESRLSHLAYAQEIAGAMLQRQQAQAVISARKQIVQGAVGMVEDALEALEERGMVQMSDTDRARLAADLLVVLSSERGTQPVLSTGRGRE